MKQRGIKKGLPLFLIVVLVAGASFFVGMMRERYSSDTKINADLIANRIDSVKKLITTEYHYTNMGSMENQNEFYGWKIPFTRKSFILSHDGVIYAGLDIDNADIRVEGKVIRIDLPEAEILSHEIKEESITIFDEETSVFNPIEIADYTSFSADQKKAMEDKAIAGGLLDKAEDNAKEAIEEVLLMNPEIANNYEIEFH
ncbi:DUF4230 domain-containing protein [Filifactor villosus]|uniref:DUF4230 domain-containing protein n=1 Tax=Filifactor villosus TaxID=29374 RepID=A0ABV9QK18_9FIRM